MIQGSIQYSKGGTYIPENKFDIFTSTQLVGPIRAFDERCWTAEEAQVKEMLLIELDMVCV